MIRIEISSVAYDYLVATMPGIALKRPQEAPGGGLFLWLAHSTRNRLMAARRPGEDYSDAIIRLARIEAAL